jgi:hypothetical protein
VARTPPSAFGFLLLALVRVEADAPARALARVAQPPPAVLFNYDLSSRLPHGTPPPPLYRRFTQSTGLSVTVYRGIPWIRCWRPSPLTPSCVFNDFCTVNRAKTVLTVQPILAVNLFSRTSDHSLHCNSANTVQTVQLVIPRSPRRGIRFRSCTLSIISISNMLTIRQYHNTANLSSGIQS